jgi:hypothetical protein
MIITDVYFAYLLELNPNPRNALVKPVNFPDFFGKLAYQLIHNTIGGVVNIPGNSETSDDFKTPESANKRQDC